MRHMSKLIVNVHNEDSHNRPTYNQLLNTKYKTINILNTYKRYTKTIIKEHRE